MFSTALMANSDRHMPCVFHALQIANSNNEGVECKKFKPVGYISKGFSCDLDYTPFPADSDVVTSCLSAFVPSFASQPL